MLDNFICKRQMACPFRPKNKSRYLMNRKMLSLNKSVVAKDSFAIDQNDFVIAVH